MNHWSSPTAHDGRRPGADVLSTQGGNLNRDAALWTTPNVPNGGRSLPAETVEARGKTDKGKRQVGLHNEAAMWTTPQAHDAAGGSPDRIRRKGTEHGCANLADDVCGWDGIK